jgi:hypothetical protein
MCPCPCAHEPDITQRKWLKKGMLSRQYDPNFIMHFIVLKQIRYKQINMHTVGTKLLGMFDYTKK